MCETEIDKGLNKEGRIQKACDYLSTAKVTARDTYSTAPRRMVHTGRDDLII